MNTGPKVLFPVNFSASCIAMAAYVKRTVGLFNATVTMVHVVDPTQLDMAEQYELYIRPYVDVTEDHKAVRAANLAKFLADQFAPEIVSRVLLVGDPATEISRYAKENGFDLIIMPTHSGRFRQTLLGSTTARVINDAPCPVMTSRHSEKISPRPLSHKEWICALDSSAYADTILALGAKFAKLANANLSLIHVLDSELDPQPTQTPDSLTTLVTRHGLATPVRSIAGPLKKSLLKSIDNVEADALIIGRSSNRSHDRMTDLTYALVRDSPFPVLSV